MRVCIDCTVLMSDVSSTWSCPSQHVHATVLDRESAMTPCRRLDGSSERLNAGCGGDQAVVAVPAGIQHDMDIDLSHTAQ